LHPDPKQPRQHISKDKIKEMAVSIKNKGVINPIEIDKDRMIITGEMRWRASMKAGLKTVPCKILELDNKTRYLRQMHENIHHASMNSWDVAKGLSKSKQILGILGSRDLSKEFGKSHTWVLEHLRVLEATKEFQEAIKAEKLDYTKLRPYRRIPDEYKDWAKKNLLMNMAVSRGSFDIIVVRVLTAKEHNETNVIKKIVGTDWSGKTILQTAELLNKIYPPERQVIDDAQAVAKLIQTKVVELTELLEMYPLGFFGKLANISVSPFLLKEVEIIGNYLANKPVQGNYKLKGRKNNKKIL